MYTRFLSANAGLSSVNRGIIFDDKLGDSPKNYFLIKGEQATAKFLRLMEDDYKAARIILFKQRPRRR